MNNKCLCKAPFSYIEINTEGNVTVCCPVQNSFVLGNIYKNSFDEIWNSINAKKLRADVLNRKYSYCNLNVCNPIDNIENNSLKTLNAEIEFSTTPPYPKYVKFCHDTHCNIKCITCRDDFCINTKHQTEKLNSYIEETYLPILKNCEVVSLNGSGEALASEHCKMLIKKITKKYPNIKFDLHTNGILCNQKVLEDLEIINKLNAIHISMHAFKKETYKKIHLAGNYDLVLKNINWLSNLLKQGKLKQLDLYFVVQEMNYKEIIPFIEFAKSVGANVYFWEYRNWGTKLGKKYSKIAVFEKYHNKYNDLAKILQNPIFNSENVHLNNYLKKIKPISIHEKIQEKLIYLLSPILEKLRKILIIIKTSL